MKKVLTEKQLKVFGVFRKNVFKEYTFLEIKRELNEKSHSLIQNALKAFLNQELIIHRKIGTSKLYKINHENHKSHLYLELSSQELSKSVSKSVQIIKKSLKKASFYSLVIFGSYADNTQKNKSDLDVAIIIPDSSQKTKVEIALKEASNKTLLTLDYHVITETEFKEMLIASYENIGKEIARKNLPVLNASSFYRIIINSTHNEFNLVS